MDIEIIRLVAGGLLALCSCYIGIIIKRHYIEREKFFKDITAFCVMLNTELSFKKSPLPDVINRYSFQKKGLFVGVLAKYFEELKKGTKSIELYENINIAHLKVEEKKVVLDFLQEVGKTTLDDQLSLINRAVKDFEDRHIKSSKDTIKLGGMYFKLAVLIGIALIVICA